MEMFEWLQLHLIRVERRRRIPPTDLLSNIKGLVMIVDHCSARRVDNLRITGLSSSGPTMDEDELWLSEEVEDDEDEDFADPCSFTMTLTYQGPPGGISAEALI
jgi:hypothetical protein